MNAKKWAAAAIAAFLWAWVAGPPAAAGAADGIGVVTPQIVGGSAAPEGQHRWIASIQRKGHFCGASLIADRWVVTAAHCVVGEKAKKIKVWIGGHDLRRPGGGVTAKVVKIHLHPKYDDDTLRNDLALLELASPIAALAPVVVADAAQTQQLAPPGAIATVSGWGQLSESGRSPNLLHQVDLPVVSNGECNSPASYDGEIAATQICAGLRQGGKDSCFGDSGGPLWVRAAGEDYLVGIVSWGDGCAQPRKYGVYTRLASFAGWIEARISGGGSGGGGGGGGPSCEGRCGGSSGRCWCDAQCERMGDCCSDYQPVCGGGGGSTACTDAVCDIDPYCCEVEWDELCEEWAGEVC